MCDFFEQQDASRSATPIPSTLTRKDEVPSPSTTSLGSEATLSLPAAITQALGVKLGNLAISPAVTELAGDITSSPEVAQALVHSGPSEANVPSFIPGSTSNTDDTNADAEGEVDEDVQMADEVPAPAIVEVAADVVTEVPISIVIS
ncbi:hypothetical protein FA15DRAFT_710495 [Coprinopsis marcescibilis]|uniref:Uncharacterized protein n=1 Tax=Coprinopsis marcescibilis TaxID=230819 RepID=A0A5C3KCG6_COPMA|nr:hypothetical protein FA15DRAFT_710495 [Coprinopsis marcescibilis]